MWATSISGWHWLVLALFFLVLQAATRRALMAIAVGALMVALVMAVAPLAWSTQLQIFAAASLLASAIYWCFFRPPAAVNATAKIHRDKARLLGMRASLLTPIKAGRGKVQLRDALWPVTCGQDLPVGTVVEVTGFDNDLLHVSKVTG